CGEVGYVFHFASPASPVDYMVHGIETLKVGSLGTMHALDVAQKYRAKYLVASTSECYGDPLEHPQKETYWGNANSIGPRSVYDDCKQTRSFCYVSDEIDGILRLAKSNEHFPVNIGNPDEFTILECAHRVLEVTGSKSEIRYHNLPQDDPKQRRPDITKARTL